jgi:acetyltransferase-like isoleucine patch superfamily enzyme
MTSIAHTAKIFKNVRLGKNVVIEDFCIIGQPPGRSSDGELETVIGDDSIIRAHTIIYAGNKIGRNFQTGNKANLRENNDIGNDVSIGTLSVVEHHVRISDGVRIHTQAFIPEYSQIEERVWIGPNVVLTNAKYPASHGAKDRLEGPHIQKGAKIGANSTILPGVEIGENSLVGAGAVVTKDVPPNSIVMGNPAAVRGQINDIEFY